MKLETENWLIQTNEQSPEYLYISIPGMPGVIHIKREAEGVVVDVWPDSHEQVAATACATFSELNDMESEQ